MSGQGGQGGQGGQSARTCGPQLFGIAMFRHPGPNSLAMAARGGTCLLDGTEIEQPFYIDTERGIVKVYDLTGTPGLPDGVVQENIGTGNATTKYTLYSALYITVSLFIP